MGYFDQLISNPEADKAMPSFLTRPERGAPGETAEYAPPAGVDANTGEVDANSSTFAGAVDDASALYPTADRPPPGQKFGFMGFGEGGYFQRLAQESATKRNAAVNPTLATPRGPSTAEVFRDWEPGGSSAGIPSREQAAAPKGPLATAVDGVPGITRTGNSYSGVGQPSTPGAPPAYLAEYNAMRAREEQALRDSQVQGAAANRAAQSSYDAGTARRNADVATFRATNGADMVLAPENSGYDSQRRAIIANAVGAERAAENATGRAYADRVAADNGQPRNYIDEFAKTQDALSRSQIAGQGATNAGLEADLRKQKLVDEKQIAEIRTLLQNETDPAKIKVLQNKLLAMMGKQPQNNRVAVIDVDTGQKDAMNQPIFRKAAIDIETGQLLGGNQGQAAQDPVAQLKSLRPSDAATEARKAVAAGASVAAVNKMLKDAGHEELK
jgi:hypothetical protein